MSLCPLQYPIIIINSPLVTATQTHWNACQNINCNIPFTLDLKTSFRKEAKCLRWLKGCIQLHSYTILPGALKYCNMNHSSSEIKLLHLPCSIIVNDHYCGQCDKEGWLPHLSMSRESKCRTPQPAFHMILASRESIYMCCGQKYVLRICSKNFSDLYIIHKIIWDINQEICCIASILYPIIEGLFHISFLESTRMVASLLQVLVLFLNIASYNHFSASSNRHALINPLPPESILNCRPLHLQEQSQQETAQYVVYVNKLWPKLQQKLL